MMLACTRKNWSELAVYLIASLVAVLRFYSLPDYPIHDDELITLDVLDSIKQTGLPILGEKIYWRSLIAHYLMAIPQFFLGASLETARLVPVISGSCLLVYCYRIGRELAGPLAGLMTAAFLGFSVYENLYAAFARFYLLFQFFFVASLWYAYQYFLKKEKGKFWHWMLFSVAAFGSHKFALLLWPVFLYAIVIGKNLNVFFEKKLWVGVLLLMIWSYWMCFWSPPDTYSSAFTLKLSVGYLKDKLVFFNILRSWIPLGLTFSVICLIPVIWKKGSWLYFYGILAFGVLTISLLAPADNPRYVLHLFPLAVVSTVAGLAWFVQGFYTFIVKCKEHSASRFDRATAVAVGLVTLLLILNDNRNVAAAFGKSITFVNQEPAHKFLLKNLGPKDVVITVDPGITRYYIGQRDVIFLREKLDIHTGQYAQYDQSKKIGKDYYYVDSKEALEKVLLGSDTNIWLYANNKIKWAVSPSTDQLIREKFALVYKFDDTWLLLYRPYRQ